MMLIQVQTPPGATVERTEKVLDDVRQYLDANESNLVESTFAISGFNFAGHGQNSGLIFLRLKDWSTRTAEKDKVQALVKRIGDHRSEERRVGKGCVSTGRYRWEPYHEKKKKYKNNRE